MKAAISTDGEYVSAHFGRCPSFTIVELEDGKVKNTHEAANPGHQPGLIPEFLNKQGVDCIICGGMGMRAAELFKQYDIQTILGVSGSIAGVVEELKKGTLKGSESLCRPGSGKGHGVEKNICDHPHE